VADRVEWFEKHALGRPYHAALVDLRTRSEPHRHRDYCEIMVIVDGTGEHIVYAPNGSPQVFELRGGDVVFVRRQDRHQIVGAVRFYNVAFPATAWRAFVALAKVDIGTEGAGLPAHTIIDDDQAARACAEVLDAFHRNPRELDLVRFWTAVVPLFMGKPDSMGMETGIPDWLASATAAMRREDNLRAGVARLLALAHVSAAHLSRSMRRHYGMTPSEFVADLRLQQASTMLATTTRQITDIAHTCGFGSTSYFSRRFRAAHGVTPRQFRYSARHAFVPR
jgi:AraC-like DNA-binding protein